MCLSVRSLYPILLEGKHMWTNSLRAGRCAYLHTTTGDVNLAEDQVRGNHNPGAGGWPTIKYFNKETGYAGGAYIKKDAGAAMCDELGKVDNMEEYVTSYGKTSLCSAVSGRGCSDKEKAYIEKMKAAGSVKQTDQLSRLSVRLLRITVSLVLRRAVLRRLLSSQVDLQCH